MSEITGWAIIAAGAAVNVYGWLVLIPDLRRQKRRAEGRDER